MADLNKPMLAGHLLDALYWSVRNGKALSNIPGLVEQLVAEDIWKEVYVEETERTVTYDSFEDFLNTPPPEGLGVKPEDLKNLIKDDLGTLNLLDEALQGKPGRPLERNRRSDKIVNNVHNKKRKSPVGNNRQASIRRLRKHRPDLLQRVLNKDISVNQAMVEGGFRKKQLVVMKDTKLVAKMLKSNFTQDELEEIITELHNQNDEGEQNE